jgi:hypothetical protein
VSYHAIRAASSVSGWAIAGYIVGGLGFALAGFRELRERRDRQRLRPVVVVHEHQRRFIKDRRFIVTLYLTNESATPAFNIRFGVTIRAAEIGWRHDPNDIEESRLNVLQPGDRWPDSGVIELELPDDLVFSADGDPDWGRRFWARYQSPSGEWWYTSNPTERHEDLLVKRIRSRKWSTWRRNRQLERHSKKGKAAIGQIEEELRANLFPADESKPEPPSGR